VLNCGGEFGRMRRQAVILGLLACYPRFPEFLQLKLQHDPQELFQSDGHRHYRALFSG